MLASRQVLLWVLCLPEALLPSLLVLSLVLKISLSTYLQMNQMDVVQELKSLIQAHTADNHRTRIPHQMSDSMFIICPIS